MYGLTGKGAERSLYKASGRDETPHVSCIHEIHRSNLDNNRKEISIDLVWASEKGILTGTLIMAVAEFKTKVQMFTFNESIHWGKRVESV